ncbi:DUF4352 domain-containing protein [Isoptericola halotolerans]|uniref:DUF4352 domain-containing protein n=1 Tax=Isoptericola halotolerans TaxID=300560 RepID=UPI003890659E
MSMQQPDPSQQQPSSFGPPPGGAAPGGATPYGQQPLSGPQPPYGQAPQGWTPPPPAPEKRKNWFARHKVLTGLGVLVGVAIVGAALGGEDESTVADDVTVVEETAADVPADDDGADDEEAAAENAAAEDAAAGEPAPADLPGLGDPVRDGKFEFTVTELEDDVQQIGDDFLNEKAQGRFLLVHVTVENIGDEAQYFDGDSQKLVDTKGRTHSADTGAAIYLDDSNSFLNEINPGNSVDGVVVFDLPADASAATLELHDSMFSGGVEVSVE